MERPSTLRGGTAIAAIWTPDEVVIAADSADNEMVEGEMRTVDSACKIRIYGKFVFAAKGIRCGEPDFDVYSIAEQILCQDRSLAEVVICLKERLEGPLRAVADHLRETDWQTFNRVFRFEPLVVVVAANEGDDLQMVFVRAVVKHDEVHCSLTMEGHHCPAEVCDGASFFLPLAPSTEAEEDYQKLHRDKDTDDPVSKARDFVQFMIDRKEEGVGPPIDIMQITRLRRRWVQCKSGCEGIG